MHHTVSSAMLMAARATAPDATKARPRNETMTARMTWTPKHRSHPKACPAPEAMTSEKAEQPPSPSWRLSRARTSSANSGEGRGGVSACDAASEDAEGVRGRCVSAAQRRTGEHIVGGSLAVGCCVACSGSGLRLLLCGP